MTVKDLWDHFAGKVLAEVNQDSIQYNEMQRSFYAGVFSLMTFQLELLSEEEAAGAQELENMYQECESFFKNLK